MSSLVGTLGFFRLGIPVIFVRSDLYARIDADTWQSDLHDLAKADPTTDEAAIRHELRHFHDALVVPLLFNQFIIEVRNNIVGAILVNNMLRRGRSECKLADLEETEYDFLQAHLKNTSQHHRQLRDFAAPVWCSALSVQLDFWSLMETNAILTELHFVRNARGESAMVDYWTRLDTQRSTPYREIISRFLGERSINASDVTLLHTILLLCLYSTDDPMRLFSTCLEEANTIQALLKCRIALMDELRRIDVVEHAIGLSTVLQCNRADTPTDHLGALFVQPDDIVLARRRIVHTLLESQFSLDYYVENLKRFPIPPSCFYADEEMLANRQLPFVRKSQLRSKYGDVFTLCSHRDPGKRTTISAGYIPTLGITPFIPISKVDTMLAFRFLSQRLFGEVVSYSPEIDELFSSYRHLFQGDSSINGVTSNEMPIR